MHQRFGAGRGVAVSLDGDLVVTAAALLGQMVAGELINIPRAERDHRDDNRWLARLCQIYNHQTLKQGPDGWVLLMYQQTNKRCFVRATSSPEALKTTTRSRSPTACQHSGISELIDHGVQQEWFYVATEYMSQAVWSNYCNQAA